jgi:hypothetical protein
LIHQKSPEAKLENDQLFCYTTVSNVAPLFYHYFNIIPHQLFVVNSELLDENIQFT